MTGHEIVALSEVVGLQRGHDLPSQRRNPGSVPILGSFGVTGWHDTARYNGPGVTIGRSGASIGVATFVDSPYWPLNTALFVKDFKGNDPRWVYFLLDAIDFSSYNSGSAQPSLNRNFLADIPVPHAPLMEQRAIAATLGALDDKIESNRRAHGLLGQLLDSLAERESTALPQVELAELVVLNRKAVNIVQFSDAQVAHYSLPAFDDGQRPELVEASTIKSNKLLLTEDSVLVSRLNPRFNRTWLAKPAPEGVALASTEFAAMTPRGDHQLATLWLAVRSPVFRAELPLRVTGTSGSHQRIRPDDMLSIPVPDTRQISAGLIDAAESLLQRSHALVEEEGSLGSLRDALLPELLSGRIKVSEARETIEETIDEEVPHA